MTPASTTVGTLAFGALASGTLAFGTLAAPAAAQSGPFAVRVSAEAGGGYESNVRFQRADDAGDIARRLRVAAGAALRSRRADLTLSAAGDATSYQTLRDLDRLTYQLALDAGRALTPRLRVQGGAVARRSQASTIEQHGVTLPLVALTTSDAFGGALSGAYRLTPRTTVLAATSFTDVRFDATALAGGTTATAEASVDRRTAPRATLGVRYHGERTALAAQTLTSHALTGEWSAARGTLSLRARGGVALSGAAATPAGDTLATPRTSARATPRPVGAVGDLTLERRRGALAVALAAGRAVSPALGIGRVLATEHVGATVERASPRATVRAAVDHAWSADPSDRALQLRATTASIDARHPIARSRSWIALGAFLRERRAVDVVRDHGVTLGLGVAR